MAKGYKSYRKKRRGGLVSAAQLFDGLYPEWEQSRALLRTFSWWDGAVSERVAKHARPVRLFKGTLVVHTRSSAWAQELSFHEEDLLRSIRARVPDVQRIRIRVGPFPRPPAPPEKPGPAYVPMPVLALPPELARALAHVPDDGLRAVLTRAACTALSEERVPPPKKGPR
ncbi:MAG: DciA family protein [Sandaracinaceae bacterium]